MQPVMTSQRETCFSVGKPVCPDLESASSVAIGGVGGGVCWLPVVGFDGAYEVSDLGQVRSVKTGRLLKPARINSLGHLQVKLYRDGKQHGRLVHRLVLEAFKGPCPPGMEARHVQTNDTSDNRLGNLAWGTYTENELDKRAHGTSSLGRRKAA